MNEIIIKPVANGFIVTVPYNAQSSQMDEFKEAFDHIIKRVKKNDRDELLHPNNDEDFLSDINKSGLYPMMQPDMAVYIFKKFEEVISFLQDIKL